MVFTVGQSKNEKQNTDETKINHGYVPLVYDVNGRDRQNMRRGRIYTHGKKLAQRLSMPLHNMRRLLLKCGELHQGRGKIAPI